MTPTGDLAAWVAHTGFADIPARGTRQSVMCVIVRSEK
jgi:hypothetical protein